MWKPEHRLAADRRGLRYPSDLTDAEWAIVAAMIPPGRHGGRRRSVNVREVLNGIFYVLWTGCQWKALPKDLPPKSTVHDYLELWNWDGTLERIHHTLYVAVREEEGREAWCGALVPGICRSSSDRTLLDLRCCLNGGSSNERSRGLVVTVVWLATSNATQRPLLHSSASP